MEKGKKKYIAPKAVLCDTQDVITTSNELKWHPVSYAVHAEPCNVELYNIS